MATVLSLTDKGEGLSEPQDMNVCCANSIQTSAARASTL